MKVSKQDAASMLQESFLSFDLPRKQHIPKKVLVAGNAAVGRHGVMNADGTPIAVFKGRKKKDGTVEVLAAPIKRQITLKHGKDYSGKVGAKTQAKIDVYKAAHPETT